MSYILCIGDLHFPWVDKVALRKLLKSIDRPKVVVQLGDLYDMYSHSKYPRTHNLFTPKDELIKAREMAEEFWAEIRVRTPRAERYQLMGNHDIRPFKRMIEKYPEFEHQIDINHLWEFDRVKTMRSDREELIIDDMVFIHGYRARLGDHARFNHMKTVCGHTHRGGVHFINLKNKIIWELNCGHLADKNAVPLSYTKQRQFSNWTLGYGIIDAYGPRFIPLET